MGVSQTTVKRWISLLENSRIIYLLRPYTKNINKRIIKSPKIYFFDTGLVSYLLRYPDSDTLSKGQLNGAILENFALSELLKTRMNGNLLFEPFFYRDGNGNEIDIVLDHGYKTTLCEVKLGKTIRPAHYRSLEKLSSLFSNPELFLISGNGSTVNLTSRVRNVPAWMVSKILS